MKELTEDNVATNEEKQNHNNLNLQPPFEDEGQEVELT